MDREDFSLYSGDSLRKFDEEIAEHIGLTESIILSQIDYWITTKKKPENKEKFKDSFRDGKVWVYNSYHKWHNQFPYFSESTIKRAIHVLEDMGLLIVGNYNLWLQDKSKWYTINYERLCEVKKSFSSGQIDQMDGSNWSDGRVKLTQALPNISQNISSNILTYRDYTERTAEKSGGASTDDQEIIQKSSKESGWHWKSVRDYNNYVKCELPRIVRNMVKGQENEDDAYGFYLCLFREYYKRYRLITGELHPWYKIETFEKVVRNFFSYFGETININTLLEYADKFFEQTAYRQHTLAVFSQYNTLEWIQAEIEDRIEDIVL